MYVGIYSNDTASLITATDNEMRLYKIVIEIISTTLIAISPKLWCLVIVPLYLGSYSIIQCKLYVVYILHDSYIKRY